MYVKHNVNKENHMNMTSIVTQLYKGWTMTTALIAVVLLHSSMCFIAL